MLDETTGVAERRAVLYTTVALFVISLWAFTTKLLPMDAALWTLQVDYVHLHLFGQVGAESVPWNLISIPSANVGAPLLGGLLSVILSPEVAVRFLLCFGGIFLRGLGLVALFRVLRVRDEAIYYLIPVLVMGGLWFTGSLPYLLGETAAIWIVTYLLSLHHPRSGSYWVLSFGIAIVALLHALAFVLLIVVVIGVVLEQRRTVHLSQGWLGSPRALLGLLLPGLFVLGLSLISKEPVFRISTSNLLPVSGFGRLLLYLTPAPDVLEATFRYGDILHGLLTILFIVVVLGCLGRALLLAIEEATWRSRALRWAGIVLFVLCVFGGWLGRIGFESTAWLDFAVAMILAGAYSRGPAVRRTPLDHLLLVGSIVTVVATLLLNGFSLLLGSNAATETLSAARGLVAAEHQDMSAAGVRVREVRFVLDSALAQDWSLHSVGTVSYSQSAPIYLYRSDDVLRSPWAFQTSGGIVSTHGVALCRTSPARQLQLATADAYIDSTTRTLAVLPMGMRASQTFGPFALTIREDERIPISHGEAKFQLVIGAFEPGRQIDLADAR